MQRLLNPRSIAVIGGGAWCEAVVEQNLKIGFEGDLWVVHPSRESVGGVKTVRSVRDLPSAPDAAFVGVNRLATLDVVRELAAMGAGGAVCFASGFSETDDGDALSDALLEAAADMTLLGPNCYGALNALAGAALWPDQHGLSRVTAGVAIVAQSSNIAINLTMQRRGLPISHVVTVGNQVQQGLAEIGMHLLQDPAVTALGLYIESFRDVAAFEKMATVAAQLGKGVVALKVGRSEAAQTATVSHTASLAGTVAGSDALLKRLGIAKATSPAVLLETLKIYHTLGPLTSNRIASLSCSGGEASVVADLAADAGLEFPPLTAAQEKLLSLRLSTMVRLANPLDYHTEIWRDAGALQAVFEAMATEAVGLTVVVLDFPRSDMCDDRDWVVTLDAVKEAAHKTGRPFAVLASLVETFPEAYAVDLMAAGVVPLSDMAQGMEAIAAAVSTPIGATPTLNVAPYEGTQTLSEHASKAELAEAGLDVPNGQGGLAMSELSVAARAIGFPLVLKGEGLAHKSDAGLVALGLGHEAEVLAAADRMGCDRFALDEMIQGDAVELLVGVVRDPATGFVLTLAAGGVLTEILSDSASLLLPANKVEISNALRGLRVAALLRGYRGQKEMNFDAAVEAVALLAQYVERHMDAVVEVEINPLMVTKERAVAVDALIVKDTS